jgi:hypothetical protein
MMSREVYLATTRVSGQHRRSCSPWSATSSHTSLTSSAIDSGFRIALPLWVAGLAALLAHLAGLNDEYTLQTGAYVAPTLLVVGLLATVAMWPAGLATRPLRPLRRRRTGLRTRAGSYT